MSNFRMVFSTDPKDQVTCEKCKKNKSDCSCVIEEEVHEDKIIVIFRLEKSGRGGKTVTVMDGFPKNEEYLKKLTKELKSKCGVGGTHVLGPKSGLIEIQGDKREVLKKLLTLKNIKFKGV